MKNKFELVQKHDSGSKPKVKEYTSNVTRHTKSSAALITTKHFSDTNFRNYYKDKIELFQNNELEHDKFKQEINRIKIKRRMELSLTRNRSASDLSVVMEKSEPKLVPNVKDEQQLFIERRKMIAEQVKQRQERIVEDVHKIKIFKYRRKTVYGNARIKLKALKIARIWQEKRKIRFIKLMMIRIMMHKLFDDYSIEREKWLFEHRKHMAAFKMRIHYKALALRYAPSYDQRAINNIRQCLNLYAMQHQNKVKQSRFVNYLPHQLLITYCNNNLTFYLLGKAILLNFLDKVSTKFQVNQSFLNWIAKVNRVQDFLIFCLKRKHNRIQIMITYWDQMTETAQYQMLINSSSGMTQALFLTTL